MPAETIRRTCRPGRGNIFKASVCRKALLIWLLRIWDLEGKVGQILSSYFLNSHEWFAWRGNGYGQSRAPGKAWGLLPGLCVTDGFFFLLRLLIAFSYGAVLWDELESRLPGTWTADPPRWVSAGSSPPLRGCCERSSLPAPPSDCMPLDCIRWQGRSWWEGESENGLVIDGRHI